MLAGDVMLGRGVNEVIQRVGPSYPVELLEPVTRDADLLFVNLECAISARNELFSGAAKVFYFRADPPAIRTLTHLHVDLVSLANNHALDAGHDALLDTIKLLDEHNIAHVGAGANLASAHQPVERICRDQRIGVIAACDHQPDFAATAQQPGIRYVDLRDVASVDALVRDAAELAARVDHAIVSLHWQPNWAPHIDPRYREVAHRLIDAGVRIVWGHSPHHFQGVEWIGRNVILYATGDLLDDYAIEVSFRNDRQLLFEALLDAEGVQQLRVLPLELEYAHPHPALPQAHHWITQRMTEMCQPLGTTVQVIDNWLALNG